MRKLRGFQFLHCRIASLVLLCVLAMSTLTVSASQSNTPWNTLTPALPQELVSHVVVATESRLYVIGGKNKLGNPVANVWFAQLPPDTDNTVNGWNGARSLPVPLYLHAAVYAQTSKNIYVIGGWDGQAWHADVWRAAVNTDGTLGDWIHENDYCEKVVSHDVIVVADKLYGIGGQNNNKEILNKVCFATIHTDGTLSAWSDAGDIIVDNQDKPLFRLSAVVDTSDNQNPVIYATGGSNGKRAQSAIYAAAVNTQDGTLGNWYWKGDLPEPVYYHKALIASHILPNQNTFLYIIGGSNENVELNAVYSFQLDNPCSQYVTQPGLVESLTRFAAVVVPSFTKTSTPDSVYVLGGLHINDYRNNVYVAKLADITNPHNPGLQCNYLPIIFQQP